MITAGVGLDDAGINGEALAFNQTSVHAGPYHRFKDLAQEVAVAETAVAIHRECRVIRHRVVKIEPTEPPIRHVHLDFLAQPPLEADAVAIADDQHSDHKLGINRRPANVAIEGCELLPKLNQYPRHDRINPPQQMARRDAPFKVEQVKQLALIARLSTQHGKPPPAECRQPTESLFVKNHEPFFNAIGQSRTSSPLCNSRRHAPSGVMTMPNPSTAA